MDTVTRDGGEDVDLQLTDPGQVTAVRAAVYRSARATGIGPDRARRLAIHVALHLVGQLRAAGYVLRVEWVALDVRDVLEAARTSGEGPEIPAETVDEPGLM